jgi:hypothetical protein
MLIIIPAVEYTSMKEPLRATILLDLTSCIALAACMPLSCMLRFSKHHSPPGSSKRNEWKQFVCSLLGHEMGIYPEQTALPLLRYIFALCIERGLSVAITVEENSGALGLSCMLVCCSSFP